MKYAMITSSAKLVGGYGNRRNVAIVSYDRGEEPKIIRETSRVKIVRYWGSLNAKGINTAYARACAEAVVMLAELNGGKN
jgi:hypothetical protein